MKPSKYQLAIYDAFDNTDRNINISAVAGSGKTTVLIELLKHIPNNSRALFLAFNNSIVDELKDRTEGIANVDVTTIHSYGWRSILCRYGSKIKVNPNKGIAKTEKVLKSYDIKDIKKGWFFYIIPKIIDLLRCNLREPNKDDINEIAEYYDLNISDLEVEIASKVFKEMQKDKSQFDFTDMIYQPSIDPSLRLKKYDYVFCDESQDFSAAQQKVILLSLSRKGRLVSVGDEHQAIYGFAGADANSYEKLSNLNGSALSLPLSVSYRCAKNIVREAQKIVPAISYSDTAIDGIVRDGTLIDLEYGDWILCRNLKPLVQTYIWLMKNKIKSKIRGKEIGEGILSLISKTGAKTIRGLNTLLEVEKDKLFKKLQKRGVRHPSLHPKMEVLSQNIEVIQYLSLEVSTVDALIKMIRNIFSDDVKGILLSTIHKAKGLENDKIFFLCPELLPSKFATQPWQLEQEENLKYVAITRARSELIYVNGTQFKSDIKSKIII